MSGNPEIIRVEDITKRFGGVVALDRVSVTIHQGEIHALVGENGAGKSTLMKILAGVHPPDEGRVFCRGQEVALENPRQAQRLGIATVFQESSLFPDLSVYCNIFVNREMTAATGLFDVATMRNISKQVIESMGHSIDPDIKVARLSTAERQLVEIARALSRSAEVIIMDEPNSALGEAETKLLFGTLRSLREKGITIIYVSHRLEEVCEISDRITVLRDGHHIGTQKTAETSIPDIISQMIGRTLEEAFPHRDGKPNYNKPVLTLRDLSKEKYLDALGLTLHEGEILGIAGLEGCGKEELFQMLFGLQAPDSGDIEFESRHVELGSALDAINLGWSMIPSDRRQQGVMIDWPILDNAILVILDRLTNRLGLINYGEAVRAVQEFIDKLDIATDSPHKMVHKLSGGNQQKIVLAKWLATEPRFLLLNDPTRGIDVGTKAEIYKLMNELADAGMPILFTSSEADEILGLSDRVVVLYKGRKVFEFGRGEASKEEVLHYVTSGLPSNHSASRTHNQA